jgi:hypothetical protein
MEPAKVTWLFEFNFRDSSWITYWTFINSDWLIDYFAGGTGVAMRLQIE